MTDVLIKLNERGRSKVNDDLERGVGVGDELLEVSLEPKSRIGSGGEGVGTKSGIGIRVYSVVGVERETYPPQVGS